jgi:two-component system response regulator NreC
MANSVDLQSIFPDTAPLTLSPREFQILKLIAFGHTNKEISEQLDLSVKTVEAHKANGMRKLRCRTRADLVRYAVGQDWYTELRH